MSLSKAIATLKLDTRMTEWNLKNNKLSKTDHEAHLKNLPDLKEKSENLNLERRERAEIH